MKFEYAVLFVGTPFMDGRYSDVESAYEVKEYFEETYPHQHPEIIKVSDSFKVTDDIFWNNHKEEIKKE
tara:strand:- start:218 stop:424 length:207 start_codon:yes stop_codon:yes gene_type:complete